MAVASKRLAKMFLTFPKSAFGSYQLTHGTVRPVPAKSTDGASASWLGSMFGDGGLVGEDAVRRVVVDLGQRPARRA